MPSLAKNCDPTTYLKMGLLVPPVFNSQWPFTQGHHPRNTPGTLELPPPPPKELLLLLLLGLAGLDWRRGRCTAFARRSSHVLQRLCVLGLVLVMTMLATMLAGSLKGLSCSRRPRLSILRLHTTHPTLVDREFFINRVQPVSNSRPLGYQPSIRRLLTSWDGNTCPWLCLGREVPGS